MLMRAGIAADDAALDAEVLARHVLDWDRATPAHRGRDPLPSALRPRCSEALLARRASREPVAYIIGHREFWGLEFEVTADVLIPRPETELIIEEALAALPRRDVVRHIVDVGTGSGCLAVALARRVSRRLVITATDTLRRRAGCRCAQRRAARRRRPHRVRPTPICCRPSRPRRSSSSSNPPYVPASDAATLPPEVGRYEPPSRPVRRRRMA